MKLYILTQKYNVGHYTLGVFSSLEEIDNALKKHYGKKFKHSFSNGKDKIVIDQNINFIFYVSTFELNNLSSSILGNIK